MDESILDSIKKDLGLDYDYEVFDPDVLMFINGVFATLIQIGVDCLRGKFLEDSFPTWGEYFDNDSVLVSLIHPYTYIKVRMNFDPPASSFVLDRMKAQADELEWRIHMQVEGAFDVKDE